MSAIVPTVFSVEMSAMPPQTTNYTPVPPQVHYGRRRSSWFQYALAGAEAQDTTIIALCIVPKNSRIQKSDIFIDAGPGANVTFDIGLVARDGSGVLDADTSLEEEAKPYDVLPPPSSITDTGNLLGSFAPANAAAAGNFADTMAHKVGFYTRKDCILIATVKTANVAAPANILGYINYVVD
jgi:hypothetical protein